MSNTASPWDELPNESEQQHLISFNQRMEIGFDYFFDRYYLLIFTYTFFKLREKAVSEEITNDSFMAIWTSKKTFKTADHLKHYLLVIVRNKCTRHHYKARAEGKGLSHYKYLLGNPVSDLEADKLYLDGLEIVLEEYHKLSPKKKDLVEKIVLEGMKNKQYAENNNLPEKSVAVKKERVLKWMRTEIIKRKKDGDGK